ncbi:MAG TPA: ABC transporter permease [Streptosporangiaceae bacterium]|jgi:hypothetical protein
MWITPERRRMRHWLVPVLVALVGVALAITLFVRDRTGSAVATLAVLAGYAALLAFRGSEPALPISDAFGTGRRATLHLRAAAMTGDVLVAAIVGALVVQALRGAAIGPLAWLAGLAGVTYVLSLLLVDAGP